MLNSCSKLLTNTMVSTSTHGVGSDVESPMMSLSDDVMNNDSNLQCPHCNFRCNSATTMTQHSWEEHPLLMRRKKHLIPSSKMDVATSSHSGDTIHDGHTTFVTKTPSPVNETAHEMQNCSLSGSGLRLNGSQEDAEAEYRNNARRSLSLLTTAADLLERQQSVDAPQRHAAVVKPQPVDATRPFPQYDTQPLYAPLYNVYVPGLNQFVTIPIAPGTMLPYPGVVNTGLNGAVTTFGNTQLPNTQLAPRVDPVQYFSRQKLTPTSPLSKSAKPTSEEIRSLLQNTKAPVWKMAPLSTPTASVKVTKPEPVEPASTTPIAPMLDKERVQALEKAILSTDYCDINDTSTTMPFKCSDGVWRMVTFKCIKGLWVVQTPNSSTPTVYVPCDETMPQNECPPRKVRSLSDVGHKRKLSDGIGSDVDAKRLCASAPVFNLAEDSGSGISLKRTLSNPFITKSLPAPSQHFTNNEGKRVNISVIKRNSPQSNSCNLIKSLLLRKPIVPSSTRTVSSSSGSVTSSSSGEMSCKVPRRPPINLAQSILRSSLAY